MATVALHQRRESLEDHLVQDEQTGEKLELAVFNLIHLGEWEAARGHLKVLAARQKSRERAKLLLKSIILGSKEYWCVAAAQSMEIDEL